MVNTIRNALQLTEKKIIQIAADKLRLAVPCCDMLLTPCIFLQKFVVVLQKSGEEYNTLNLVTDV